MHAFTVCKESACFDDMALSEWELARALRIRELLLRLVPNDFKVHLRRLSIKFAVDAAGKVVVHIELVIAFDGDEIAALNTVPLLTVGNYNEMAAETTVRLLGYVLAFAAREAATEKAARYRDASRLLLR